MKRFEKLQEKIFIARLHAHDSDAFAEVYDYYLDRIYRFIFFRVAIQEEAQDLTSEVFLKTWKYIYEKRGKIDNLNAFLYQTARNLIVDQYRDKDKLKMAEYDENTLNEVIDERQMKIFSQIDINEEFQNIEEIVKDLKDEYREIIILKFIEELSDSEISKIINKSRGNVRVLAHRALEKIREKIESQKNG